MTAVAQDAYSSQRENLIGRNERFADILPAVCPAMPSIKPLSTGIARACLGESANNHSSLQIVVGWGDGSIIHHILNDNILRQKHTIAIILKGEGDAFAASLKQPVIEKVLYQKFNITYYSSDDDINGFINNYFSKHHDIPPLAGCDIIDQHPLTNEAEQTRQNIKSRLYQALADQPYHYGNDIYDSFIGIEHASANAQRLLPAPTLGEVRNIVGDRPLVSIAAGPSLQDHIDELREIQDRCVLIACDAVVPGLIDAGIEPHFVTPLERVEQNAKFLAKAEGSRAIYAGLPVVPPFGVEYFGDRCIGVYAGDRLYEWLLPENEFRINTGTSTGVLSYTMAGILGTGDVYLVGHDLAKSEGATHWTGADTASDLLSKARDKVDQVRGAMSGYEERRVPGNNDDYVYALAWWDRFRREIEIDVHNLKLDKRQTCNVNINRKVGAKIAGCVAGDLPKRGDLDPMKEIVLPERKPERYEDWKSRASMLGKDAHNFVHHMQEVMDNIDAMRKSPPHAWDIQKIADSISLTDPISDGNKKAYAYFLRSALHNSNAEMHIRRRTPSQARFRWQTLNTMETFCDTILLNMKTLIPKLERIVHEYTR